MRDEKYDGMIITGAPVEQMPYEDVNYWDEMLCEEFVALKMSLLWGKSTRTNILSSYKSKPFIYLPEKVNKKEREACSKHFRFKRDVAKYLTDDILDMPSNANEKCFFTRTSSLLAAPYFNKEVMS